MSGKAVSAIKKYLRFIYISFRNGTVYRLNYYAGIVNVGFMIAVSIILWASLYSKQNLANSIQHRMMVTYLIFSIISQGVFMLDEFFIESKVRDGTVIHYLIKPMSFRLYSFFSNLGRAVFNLVFLFIPSIVIVKLFFNIVPPASLENFLLYVLSMILGYCVLFSFSFIFWTFAFEYLVCFGLVMLKNALVVVLSGAIVPLWFMPEEVANILSYLPFQSIYYFPLSIYLGIVTKEDIVSGILMQIVWIILFAIIGHFAWKRAVKEVVIQGG